MHFLLALKISASIQGRSSKGQYRDIEHGEYNYNWLLCTKRQILYRETREVLEFRKEKQLKAIKQLNAIKWQR